MIMIEALLWTWICLSTNDGYGPYIFGGVLALSALHGIFSVLGKERRQT
jgi:hypothetical protein